MTNQSRAVPDTCETPTTRNPMVGAKLTVELLKIRSRSTHFQQVEVALGTTGYGQGGEEPRELVEEALIPARPTIQYGWRVFGKGKSLERSRRDMRR